MQRLIIRFEHCYGIKKLSTELDFSESHSYALYAPNGVMKSSFAQAFKDIASNTPSRDRVFPGRTTIRKVVDETGAPLAADAVLVLPPYDEVFGNSEKTATLLVDAKLRKEYEQLYLEVDRAKERFLKAMKEQSRSKRDLETEISRTFTKSDREFYAALIRVSDEVNDLPEPQFADVPYDLVSDEKVAAFLSTRDVAPILKEYIDKYNALLAKSKYFRKGTFDYYNAATIAKSLTTHGFFKASHSVTLNAGARGKVEVKNEKELSEVIAKEKAAILQDETLRATFNEMEKRITKNEMLRDFQEFLADNEEVLALMGNLEKLKEEVWKSYFKAHEDLYNEVISKYRGAAARTKEIHAEAARQGTQWETVIDIFNRRFFVPFKLEVTNKVSVMLGSAPAPSLGFSFSEDGETAEIEKRELLQVLSTGEKKALYILNVIFEIEVRRQAKTPTVFVVDDIADSFDYKNKYAIIQYLKEIADEGCFRQILLTHNFDFFRTVNSRFVRYSHCLMAQRSTSGLELVQAAGIRNVFVNDWKLHFFDDARKRVAAVSFIRNIIEYTRGESDPDYVRLTALLHWKDGTARITHRDLDDIYRRVFSGTPVGTWASPDAFVLDTLNAEATACLNAPAGTNFENKIVLAIAIRLKAEKHMVAKIADPRFVSGLTANQTSELVDRYKGIVGVTPATLQVLDEVALMTPENIHLNSFMYEPIIDMSDEHLRALYRRVEVLV
jgi:hypothetical protein